MTETTATIGIDDLGRVLVVVDDPAALGLGVKFQGTGRRYEVEISGACFNAIGASRGLLLVLAPASLVDLEAETIRIHRITEVDHVVDNVMSGDTTSGMVVKSRRKPLPVIANEIELLDEGFPAGGRADCPTERPCRRAKCPHWGFRVTNPPGRPGLRHVERGKGGRTVVQLGQIEQAEDQPPAFEAGWLVPGRDSCELDFFARHAETPATTDEIAKSLGRSASLVRKIVKTGLKKLRDAGLDEQAIRALLERGY